MVVISAQLGANTKVVAQRRRGGAGAARARRCGRQASRCTPTSSGPPSSSTWRSGTSPRSLLLGAVLVAVVLLVFLSDVGAAAISLTAIPLSLLAALIVLDRLGFGINTLTLGGLAIALGEVVDDAIIDVENIARRLRREPPLARRRAAPRAWCSMPRSRCAAAWSTRRSSSHSCSCRCSR